MTYTQNTDKMLKIANNKNRKQKKQREDFMEQSEEVELALLRRDYIELRKELEESNEKQKLHESQIRELHLKLSTGKGILIGMVFILGSGGVYLANALKRLAG